MCLLSVHQKNCDGVSMNWIHSKGFMPHLKKLRNTLASIRLYIHLRVNTCKLEHGAKKRCISS